MRAFAAASASAYLSSARKLCAQRRIVHQDIQAALLLEQRIGSSRNLLQVAQICDEGAQLLGLERGVGLQQRLDGAVRLSLGAGTDVDLGALLREVLRDLAADAAWRADRRGVG